MAASYSGAVSQKQKVVLKSFMSGFKIEELRPLLSLHAVVDAHPASNSPKTARPWAPASENGRDLSGPASSSAPLWS